MDDEAVPLSALQHYLVCPRQCALIHVEQAWLDNQRTAEGLALHRATEEEWAETRAGCRKVYGVALRCEALGLYGRADVMEFDAAGVPFPVEYKRGRPKADDRDRVQLCAQALCLEEMTGHWVTEGALFYADPRRRDVVLFTDVLRDRTRQAAAGVAALIRRGVTPPAPETPLPDCGGCSLRPLCLPDLCAGSGRRGGVGRYFRLAMMDAGL